jgi:hypothetical protein
MNKKISRAHQFVVCINNDGYKASLETGKLYRVVPDEAATHGYIRVVDETGEDYGYSANRFFPIEVPQALKRALFAAPPPQDTQSALRSAKIN